MKALLVVGSAPCALKDLEDAKTLYPDHEVMLVNGACTMVEKAEHILAGHTVKAEEFVRARAQAFPFSLPVRVHANWARPSKYPKNSFPSVTDWWGAAMSSGATSAGKAALIGMELGYYPIVLCGCPLDGSGYAPGEAKVSQDKSCQRVGDASVQDRRVIKGYRERMASLARTVFKGRVFSMSGFSREQLGAPPVPADTEWLS